MTCFETVQYIPNGKELDSCLTNIFLIIILGVLGNFDINTMGVLVHKYVVLSVLDIHVSSKRNTPNKMIPKMLQTAAQD